LDVVCVGEAVIDLIPVGESAYKACFGGAPMNTAVACSRLGLKTGVITSVGREAFGEIILGVLRDEGVDTQRVRRSPYRTTLAVVAVLPGGEREFFFYRKPWSLSADTELKIEKEDVKYAGSAKLVHFSGFILSQEPARSNVLELIEKLKGGPLLSLDPTYRADVWPSPEKARRVIYDVLHKIDILLATASELKLLLSTDNSAEAIEKARLMGIRYIGIKMGRRGGILAYPEKAVYMPTYSFVKVKDTVGAGDAWNAAVIYSILNGLSVEDALCLANAVASLKCMHIGAVDGLPTLDEARKFIARHGLPGMVKKLSNNIFC